MVILFELSLDIELVALQGQFIDRCLILFEQQPGRSKACATPIALPVMEVFGTARSPFRLRRLHKGRP